MKDQTILSTSVRSLYDSQKLRIQLGNRIVASFRDKLDIEPSQPEDDEPDGKEVLDALRAEYRRITDGVVRITKAWKPSSDLLTTLAEVRLIESYEHMVKSEDAHIKLITCELEQYPIYTNVLVNVKGCGPLMSAVIISEINIHNANYPSSLWAYCGLDVVINEDGTGEGRSKKAHHLVDKEYTNGDGEITKTKGITFNPFLKTKMVGVLGTSFIRQGGKYRTVYDNYKHRLENHPNHMAKTKGHRNNMAIRYMVKQFLSDLWLEWRVLEGLPITTPYHEGKLGHKHSKAA